MELRAKAFWHGRRVVRAIIPCLLIGLLAGNANPATAGRWSARAGTRTTPEALILATSSSTESEALRAVAAVNTASITSGDRSVLFGAWVRPRGSETHQQAVTRMEAATGRRFAIDHVYHGWDGPLIGSYERWSAGRGHALLINWKAAHETADGRSTGNGGGYVRWADIASGRYDANIVARAKEIKRFKGTVYLSFHHEPENDRDKAGWRRAGTPAEYRAAWQHIRSVFGRRHVRNVRFVLILMGWTFRSGQAAQWYPGSGVVDVIGADAYNWFGTAHPGARAWTSFDAAFRAAHRFAATKRKPFWVTETGVLEDRAHPGRKAQWYRAIAAQARAWHDLGAVIFYMGGRYGWYPDSSGRSLEAFRALGHSSLFA